MSCFETLHVYEDVTPRSAAMNMAVDEALLESARAPSLRLYRWDHLALSFGYFGRYADVLSYESERDLVRRWTGGGIVLHGADLTYSLIIPKRDPPFGSSISIYEKVHEAVRDALAATGAGVEIAAVAALYERRNHIDSAVVDRRYDPNACFTNPVRADVMVNGKKVAGAAQRRSRLGLLQQGSIQNIDLAPDFSGQFAAHLSANCRYQRLDEPLLRRAADIAEEKYATPAWLRRR
ncbi:MAG: lipoyl(octanoyl) transferase [Verrucomicrobiota bacterium]|jgi:lipoate-protein ligase A